MNFTKSVQFTKLIGIKCEFMQIIDKWRASGETYRQIETHLLSRSRHPKEQPRVPTQVGVYLLIFAATESDFNDVNDCKYTLSQLIKDNSCCPADGDGHLFVPGKEDDLPFVTGEAPAIRGEPVFTCRGQRDHRLRGTV